MEFYKLIFKQMQPIHIGAGSYGVINETRIFIPGWTMWGALTKTYNFQNGYDLSENQELFKNISCFYPSFDSEGNDVLFPQFKKGEFYLGNYSESEFRAKFVDTFVSTSINARTNTALNESLHEINVILPGVKAEYYENNDEGQLYWIGIIAFDSGNFDKVINVLEKDFFVIGGNSRCGFGRMKLISKEKYNKMPSDWTSDSILLNYLEVDDSDDKYEYIGRYELLIEIKNSWKKSMLEFQNVQFFLMPGTIIKNNKIMTNKILVKGKYLRK